MVLIMWNLENVRLQKCCSFLLIQVNKIVVEKEDQTKLMLLLKTHLTQLHSADLDQAGRVLGNLYVPPNLTFPATL